MQIKRKCEYCGEIFYRKKDSSKKYRFCSKHCCGKVTGKISSDNRKKRWSRETREEVRTKLESYFLERIEKKDNCWIWIGSIKNGPQKYGTVIFRGKKMQAHRVAWNLYKGAIPRGKCLIHKCSNSLCVKPEHLIVSSTKLKKKCEECGNHYDVLYYNCKSSRFCSLKCRSIFGGKKSHRFNYDKWNAETEEEATLALKQAFYKFVAKKGACWEWKGCKHENGYGRLTFRGKRYIASRASWIIHKGQIPSGLSVLHKCDNPECTNPEHLFLGTHRDNARDKIKKGRGHKNQLTIDKVLEIKEKLALGIPMTRLSHEYGVCVSTIKNIKYGKTWRDI